MPKQQKQAQDPSRKAAILERRATVAAVRAAGEKGVSEKQMPAVREEAKAAATETIAKKKSARKTGN